MAEPKYHEIDLGAFLADLEPAALKGLVSAPIGWRAGGLIESLRTHRESRVLGTVGDGELVSALIHSCRTDVDHLRNMIDTYRTAYVWETRAELESTAHAGTWKIPRRRPGERHR